MKKNKTGIIVPVLIITVGVAWLLNTLNVLPGVDWVWTGGLGVCGILAIVIGGLNKLTIVVSPFLLIGSILSIMRQTGKMSVDLEVPILFILFGILLLIAHLLPLKLPQSMLESEEQEEQE